MKITKIKKVSYYDLEKDYKLAIGLDKSATLDWRIRQFFEEICDDGIYRYDYTKVVPKFRFTFPFFILIILFANIFAAIKWLFTGSVRFNEKSWFTKAIVKWDRYCGFNIV